MNLDICNKCLGGEIKGELRNYKELILRGRNDRCFCRLKEKQEEMEDICKRIGIKEMNGELYLEGELLERFVKELRMDDKMYRLCLYELEQILINEEGNGNDKG